MIEAVLTDAENKQTANRAVNQWLNDLEDLAYDLDDLVDELNTEASLRKLKENKDSTSKVQKLIPTCCPNLSFAHFMSDRKFSSKLKEISSQLEGLLNQIKILSLVENMRGKHYGTGERLQTTSLVIESEVHGREEDKEKILEILLGIDSDDSPVSVIPIVGMGGVGKTTLVQLVYNDERLKHKFDLKAWACVTDDFNAFKVTKCILESVSSGKSDYENFNMLQVRLKESLSNKKFLVVLDDIWNENCGDWDILRRPFLSGKSGSKIIITTRQERVAEIMSRIPAYHVTELSEDDAVSLLVQQAFGGKNIDANPDLRDNCKSVVRRCKNLPLAVKVLGGLLRMKGPKEWEEVLESKIWMADEKSEILPALKLSYQYLPPQLKRCFAYCALFPKDYEFDKLELANLWMAEGFVQESKKELGSQYFDELLARSFFQQSSAISSLFVMHDLVNDLALFVAGDKCLRMDDVLKENSPTKISEKVRHLSFIRCGHESYHRFNFLKDGQRLRTFLPLPLVKKVDYQEFFISQRILLHLLPNLLCLRVLSINGYSIYELPNTVGDLRHLRYLGLAETSLKWLPESVSNLINLRVLILRGCFVLVKLPTRMENLVNLCHLDIAGTTNLREMPLGIAQLTSLRTLSKMIVSKSSGMSLKDLGNLSVLEGDILIEELQNVVNVQEAMDARLMDKASLKEIRFAWSKDFDGSRDKNLELDVLNALKPHENLSRLEIDHYGGEKFSNWIGDSGFFNLAKISFDFCKNCTSLPPLGKLPLLRDLSIRGMDQVKVIGAEFYGSTGHGELPFPSLSSLTFEDMPNWEEWLGVAQEVGVIEFPQLCKFYIRRCPKLVSLSNISLPSLCELEVQSVREVVLNHMHHLESLTQLRLTRIFGLTSVFKAFVQFPFTLENCEVIDCDDLVTLWPSDNTAQCLVNLQQMSIGSCPQLLSLQEIDVLPHLRNLLIWSCGALELLPNIIARLDVLVIDNCPSLKMKSSLQNCCTTLKDLIINGWVNLNMTNLLGHGYSYSCLTRLYIYSCDGLELFPHGGLPTPNLRSLHIYGCQHLKSLPDRMELLSFLVYLVVGYCPSLTELFPKGNVPPILFQLSIRHCRNLKPLVELDLQKLTSLGHFLFGGNPELVSFTNEEEHYVLPPSLSKLELHELPNLKTLSKGFQNLTSLRHLVIDKCPKLVALPMEDQVDKLSSLLIGGCTLLKKRCLKNKGDYWPTIADIPYVEIDGLSVYDPDSCA
ncbi:disease resistance RPP13 1 [Olea europaea subsp. europaea]|nr:disease resistance RPP13 1 [Olea europaea subsp. europaea]